jgi:hypothetical protein
MPIPENPLDILRQAGAPIDQLTTTERSVFSELSPEEAAVLANIQTRLNQAAAEVEGQLTDTNNVFC